MFRILYTPSPLSSFRSLKRKSAKMSNASSGVAIDSDCIEKFLELKTKRKFRYIVFKMNEAGQNIVVDSFGEPDKTYDEFIALFPENSCRYGLYDHDFTDDEGCKKSKIVFFAWAPDTAKVREKMLYSSSKTDFRRQLDGVAVEMQCNDVDDTKMTLLEQKVKGV